jgi:hypothetical protein
MKALLVRFGQCEEALVRKILKSIPAQFAVVVSNFQPAMQQRWTSHGENKGKASWGSATAFLF